MTMLATSDVLALARRSLGDSVVDAVRVEPYIDEAGDPAYSVLVILREFIPDAATTAKRFDFVSAVLGALRAAGDNRFPYVSYATSEELADAGSDD